MDDPLFNFTSYLFIVICTLPEEIIYSQTWLNRPWLIRLYTNPT